MFFKDKELLKDFFTKACSYGNSIAVPFNIFLLSGGLGAFLATAYHFIIASYFFDKFNIDYSELLKFCEDNKYLEIYRLNDRKKITYIELSRLGQWRVLSAFWHINKNNSKFFTQAERRSETLHDIAHGLGTQLLGSFLVLLLFFIFDKYYKLEIFSYTVSLWWYLLPVCLVILHFFAFRRVVLSIESVVSNFIVKELESYTQRPYILYATERDLRCSCYFCRKLKQLLSKNSNKKRISSTSTIQADPKTPAGKI